MIFSKPRNQALLLFLAAALATTLTYLSKDKQDLEKQVAREIAENTIVNFHQNFALSTKALNAKSQAFCVNPNETTLGATQAQWRLAMSDWQAVKIINFGPIKVNNLSWRLQFWPDKKNLVGRKIKSLLKSKDVIDHAKLEESSVVIQGLSALEYLLFDRTGAKLSHYQTNKGETRQCALLQTVASLTQQTAEHLSSSWQAEDEYLSSFVNTATITPETNMTDIATGTPPLTQLIESILANLETLKNDKLGAPLGLKSASGKTNAFLAEAWRSQHSLALASANLNSVRQLLVNGELLGLTDFLIANDHQALASRLLMQIDAIQTTLNTVDRPMAEAINHDESRAALSKAHTDLAALISTLKRDIPIAMNITLGFNDNDGD